MAWIAIPAGRRWGYAGHNYRGPGRFVVDADTARQAILKPYITVSFDDMPAEPDPEPARETTTTEPAGVTPDGRQLYRMGPPPPDPEPEPEPEPVAAPVPVETPDLTCTECGREYQSRGALTRHVRDTHGPAEGKE